MKVSLSALSIQTINVSCSGGYSCTELDVSIAANSVANTYFECSIGSFGSSSDCYGVSLSVPDGVVVVACGNYEACSEAVFDFSEVELADISCNHMVCQIHQSHLSSHFKCSTQEACNGVSLHCPYNQVGACQLHCTDQSCAFIDLYVPETYRYGFLQHSCEREMYSWGFRGCDEWETTCLPAGINKDSTPTTLVYSNEAAQFKCSESGASWCCPWGNRSDFNGNSTDGENEDHFDLGLLSVNLYIEQGTNRMQHIIGNTSNDFMMQSIRCEKEICFIECIDALSCALSDIQIADADTLNVLISCSADFSCLSVTIFADVAILSSNLSVTIICSGDDSCNEMHVNVSHFDSVCIL